MYMFLYTESVTTPKKIWLTKEKPMLKFTILVFVLGFLTTGSLAQLTREPYRDVCEPTVLNPSSRWASEFPTNAAFTGFFKIRGVIHAVVNDMYIPVFQLSGGIFHGYVNETTGLFMNDMYLNFGAGLQHVVRASINPIPGTSVVCQRFMEPSPEFNRDSYSEISYPGVGFGFARYFTPGSKRQVTGVEYYDFDDTQTSAVIGVTNWSRGSGAGHVVYSHTQLFIEKITFDEAVTLGYTGSNIAFPSRRGIRIGIGLLLPVEVLSQQAREQLRV